MSLDLCSKLGQEHPFAWWYEQTKVKDPEHDAWYVEQAKKYGYDWVSPEARGKVEFKFTYLSDFIFGVIEHRWSACGGEAKVAGRFPDMPSRIQRALDQALGSTNPWKPEWRFNPKQRSDPFSGHTTSDFFMDVCEIVRYMFGLFVSEGKARELLSVRLIKLGFTVEEADAFLNHLITPEIREYQFGPRDRGFQDYYDELPLPPSPINAVTQKMNLASPLFLLGSGVLLIALLLKSKRKKPKGGNNV